MSDRSSGSIESPGGGRDARSSPAFLAPAARGPRGLRELLSADEPVLAPGVYDALGARLVEGAGFSAVYMTGFGTAASLLGRPDVGLVTMSEMVDNASRIVRATSLPVIADADTGYGNPLNVIRTVQEYERAGVAGIHIEDQVAPKRCGHMEGKAVIPAAEMVAKIEAAVAARNSDDFVLIARTDARAVEGIEGALDRARQYREAGADVLFVEAATSEDEIEAVARELGDVPLLFNWAEGGKTPPVPYERLRQLGFRIVIFPISTLLSATRALQDALAEIRSAGTPIPLLDRMPSFGEFLDVIGLPEIRQLEQRFGTP
jgi:carboxyvinyl-carboxyphosphonate phosphorylmutase